MSTPMKSIVRQQFIRDTLLWSQRVGSRACSPSVSARSCFLDFFQSLARTIIISRFLPSAIAPIDIWIRSLQSNFEEDWNALLQTVEAHSDRVRPVPHTAFSPDGKQLASASDNSIIKLWDAGSGML
jgi:WD40 repeat protein